MVEDWKKNAALHNVCSLALKTMKVHINNTIDSILFEGSDQKTREINKDILKDIKAIEIICTPLYEHDKFHKDLLNIHRYQMDEMYKGLKILDAYQ